LQALRPRPIAIAGLLLLALSAAFVDWHRQLVVLAQPREGAPLSVYSRQAYYTIPLVLQNGQPYIGLVELLEPLGTVDARIDGKKLKLKFSAPGSRELELQFQDGKDKGKVKGDNLKLPANFAILNGRGYLPLSAVSEVLARTLSQQIRLNSAAQRLFIGDVGEHFTLDLRNGTPSKLFISFDTPVNPTIATESGHIRFTFRKDPVLPAIDHTTYTDPLITGAQFSEHDGVGELDVSATGALIANFADGGKTIVVTAAPTLPPEVAQPIPPPDLHIPTQPSEGLRKPSTGPRFLVLIDPAHGGTDVGAAITPEIPEKDLVLTLARRLQRELSNHGVASALLRNSDIAISLEQRAISANASRPALYVALHAANTGHGVHVFTSMLDATSLTSRDFLPWDKAQTAYLDSSSLVAGSVAAELESRTLQNTLLAAPLRPMNNVAAPAIAVEIAPPGDNVADISKVAYQDQVAQSIAAGIVAVRSKITEVRP
jgi:N-acetylmuramoyl-L-alanine amidase